MNCYLAIDIGASSGRHIVCHKQGDEYITDEVYRFYNGMDEKDGHLVWNTKRIFDEIKQGIKIAFEKYKTIKSLSIDTWGVDYVLLKGDQEVMPCYAYRDSRTNDAIQKVHSIISSDKLFEKTGIAFQPFNTIYQLYDDYQKGRLEGVTDFLMLPEFFMYLLTGKKSKEYTNATTTGLVNAYTKNFDFKIISELNLPKKLFEMPLQQPGYYIGDLKPQIAKEVGGQTKVILCATHDTASAVESIDMSKNAPYISSGTWSLLGIKVEKAITDSNSQMSGYSNEGGVGYTRYQKNIMGLWIVQCLKKEIENLDFAQMVDLAKTSNFTEIFDVNDNRFYAPQNTTKEIIGYFNEHKIPIPQSTADILNSVYHSLAYSYKVAIDDLEKNVGHKFDSLYIVGGGAKNQYLNELTQKYTNKKIIALPIEASSLGNIKIQMRSNNE
ncbi:MAG TPA: rhamnulokinase family protein [Clostridia bacterium]